MKIKFLPQNVEVEANPDKTLLQVATENHLEIRSICKGVPSCAECRVRIVEGDSNILPPSKAELSLIGTSYFIDGRRLSCQVHCFGDVTVDLTEQVERQDNQTKKIRGFRTTKQVESTAVNDMMLLNEKEEMSAIKDSATEQQQVQNETKNSQGSQQNQNREQRQSQRSQNKPQQQQKNNQQHKHHRDQQNKNRKHEQK